jgi:riboflavin kinase / FMN adenylyltransferase
MKRAVVTGNFDGLHIGHEHLLLELKALAEKHGLRPCVVSFEPHTSIVTREPTEPFLLTSNLEKKYILEEKYGIELQILPFNEEFMTLSPQEYLQDILVGQLNAGLWLLGFNHTFGQGAQGRDQALNELAANLDVKLVQGEPIIKGSEPISSTRIRDLVRSGEVQTVNKLLTHPFSIYGKVITGDKIGRTIGFPTANVEIPEWKLLPLHGVYGGTIVINGIRHLCAVHIGPRPSVKNGEIRVEAHVFDFNQDIYSQMVQLELDFRVRTIKPFSDLDSLKTQIELDIQTVKAKNR